MVRIYCRYSKSPVECTGDYGQRTGREKMKAGKKISLKGKKMWRTLQIRG